MSGDPEDGACDSGRRSRDSRDSRAFPTLSEDDVPAAIAFAVRRRRRRISPLPSCQSNGENQSSTRIFPSGLVPELAALGHDFDTVRTEHLKGQPDHEIWKAAQSADHFFDHTGPGFFRHAPIFARNTQRLLPVRLTNPSWMHWSLEWACCLQRNLLISGKDVW